MRVLIQNFQTNQTKFGKHRYLLLYKFGSNCFKTLLVTLSNKKITLFQFILQLLMYSGLQSSLKHDGLIRFSFYNAIFPQLYVKVYEITILSNSSLAITLINTNTYHRLYFTPILIFLELYCKSWKKYAFYFWHEYYYSVNI